MIGLVPTMGFLHEGHLSLIRKAKQECDKVIVSIFVNPTQFDENEDFDSYPKDLGRDLRILEKEGVEIFQPSIEEIYPGEKEIVNFPSFQSLSTKLCGIARPKHFQGVCMVVKRLFEITQPNKVYFGLKDYQQYLIISTMVKELNLPIEIVGCEIVRENDGLAISSRNSYLSGQERQDAITLHKSLILAKELLKTKTIEETKKEVKNIIKGDIDYIEIVDSETLEQDIKAKTLIALAAYIGKVRLIDNIII